MHRPREGDKFPFSRYLPGEFEYNEDVFFKTSVELGEIFYQKILSKYRIQRFYCKFFKSCEDALKRDARAGARLFLSNWFYGLLNSDDSAETELVFRALNNWLDTPEMQENYKQFMCYKHNSFCMIWLDPVEMFEGFTIFLNKIVKKDDKYEVNMLSELALENNVWIYRLKPESELQKLLISPNKN